MNNSNDSSALSVIFTSLLCVGVLILVFIFVFSPYLTIIQNRSENLNTMIVKVKGTSFEKPFADQIQYSLSDGKIQNYEYLKLIDSYNGYQALKNSIPANNYSDQVNALLITQRQDDESVHRLKFFLFSVLGALVTAFAISFGLRSQRS